jgi:anaerobic ribonucleoside-triphosphate reductase
MIIETEQLHDLETLPTLGSLKVNKRDGRMVRFEKQRITTALRKAFLAVHPAADALQDRTIDSLVDRIEIELASRYTNSVQIYEVQAVVEHVLLESHEYDVAKAYIDYRVQRDLARSMATDINRSVDRLVNKDSTVVNENANKDSDVFNTQRDLTAGAAAKAIGLRMLPSHVANAHQKGDIHYHDLDYQPYTPIDRCYECGFIGDFSPTERGFACPGCGNTDPATCDVVKRTCGYLGNPQQRPMVHGRHTEISSRVKHMPGATQLGVVGISPDPSSR